MSFFQKNTKHGVPLSILAAALLMMPGALAMAENVNISNIPLAGVAPPRAANVVLALSVEFPTAGAAYSDSTEFNQESLKKYYRGYFDNKKCYKHVYADVSKQAANNTAGNPDGYFYPTSMAGSSGAYVGLCKDADEYSGNLLNWLTMSAVDVFRSAMTGGNRAKGVGTTESAYTGGDTASETILRRANVVGNQNGADAYRLRWRSVKLSDDLIKQVLPAAYVSWFLNHNGADFREQNNYNNSIASNRNWAREIHFYNNGFTVQPFRKTVEPIMKYNNYYYYGQWVQDGTKDVYRYLHIIRNGAQQPENKYFKPLTVGIKVCDSSVGLEDNCKQYGSVYKPHGLLQKQSTGNGEKDIRVAAFGYLNRAGNDVDGGVLRSRMKFLSRTENTDGIVYGQEWRTDTGQFMVNPDSTDATSSGVTNSGVVNYLNKFGDASGYKTNDPGAELYYTALRYLRNKGAVYQQSSLSSVDKDGFPVIYNWDDPLKRGFAADSKEPQCRPNSIIYIGDTNTHHDTNLPNFANGAPSDDIQTKTYLEKLLANEGLAGTWSNNRGAVNSPAGIAGLAYWARVNDIRSDLPGAQYGNNFMIDVVEAGNYKNRNNAYYWAAKYGGFDNNDTNNQLPAKREDWTDDPTGRTSISAFTDGVPKNFAIANNPDAMTTALEASFNKVGGVPDSSQSAASVAISAGEVLNFDAANKPLVLQSVFDGNTWSGDVIASTAAYDGSNKINPVRLTTQWRAAEKLDAAYHTPSGWMARKVFTIKGQTPIEFTQANAASIFNGVTGFGGAGLNASDMAAYMLGNPAKEGEWRRRSSLMGTVVNSSVAAILPPAVKPAACNYANGDIAKRPAYYTVAANDGMLHVFDKDGNEVMAYMPSTVLPKLPAYAQRNYQHIYLNDGKLTTAETCFGEVAKSVLLGSAGRGGAAVYALDVTDLSASQLSAAKNVLWQFSSTDDADLGLTTGEPILTKNAAGKPIAIISSGYNAGSNSNKGYVFILDVTKDRGTAWQLGTNYWKVPLGAAGVGTPFAYDSNNDGVADKIFVGDAAGKMWRVDRVDTSSGNTGYWQVAYSNQAMFTPTAAEAAPITGRPFAQNIGGRLYVVVGSGQYFNVDNLTATTQNYAYGLFEGAEPITGDDLLQQQINEDITSQTELGPVNRRLWTVTRNQLANTNKGWRLKLRPGQAVASAARIRVDALAEFVAVSRTESGGEGCASGGSTSLISVDVKNGGMFNYAIFDSNLDQMFDSTDKLGGMLELLGVITPEGLLVNTNKGDIALVDKQSININDNFPTTPVVNRLSWREIF